MASAGLPRVVIVGAGFAGLYAARAFRHQPIRLTVVDRRNYHLFQPLLYQVATAALDTSDIATPIRTILRGQDNADVVLAQAVRVDLDERQLVLEDATLGYDYLILATGARDSYFGHADWPGVAPGLKTLEDALEVRRRVFMAFEEAEREPDPALQKEWMTFVLIGGGPTGVEMAGALAEIAHHTLSGDFRRINPEDTRIVLVEGHTRVLPSYPEELTESARKKLEALGVEVLTGKRVTGIDSRGVWVGTERLPARTILWSAGVVASPLGATLGVPVDRAGRVKVEPTLAVPGHPEVFVAGDLALIEQGGQPVPGVAPAAIQMGKHAAHNVLRMARGEPPLPFVFHDRGTFSVIGRGAAVGVAYARFKLKGLLAWLAWLLIHLFFLIGFRNRISVLSKWAYAYLTMRRYARLITGRPGQLEPSLHPHPDGPVSGPERVPGAPLASASPQGVPGSSSLAK